MPDKITEPSPQPMLSPETLQDGPWFEGVRRAYEVRTRRSHPPCWLVPVIGYSIAGLLWLIGWKTTAIVAASLITILTVIELVHRPLAASIQKALGIFGAWAAYYLGWVLLAPPFLIIGPLSRIFTRVMGADPLGRRLAKAPTYWHFSAPESRRTRKTRSMFCVEPSAAGGKRWLSALLLLVFFGLIAAELVLRFWFGFHNPLLYQNDADCGYRMKPNQHIVTGRGEVTINNYGMRYTRDITPQKPDGVFRILLVGDSTLFGGEDLTDSETYAALVEAKFNADYPGKKFEVLPMGTNGWGPHHTLGFVKHYGTFGADLVIIAMSAGNSDRPKYLVDSQRYLVKRPVLALQTVAAKVSWDFLKYATTTGSLDYDQDNAMTIRRIETGEAAFVETAKVILQSSPECMAEAIPQICYGMNALKGTFEEVPNMCAKCSFDRIEPQLAAMGVPMHYPKDLFVGKGTAEELWRSKKDTAHLSAKGHVLFADYLAGRIAKTSRGFRKYTGLPALPPPSPK